ncbi:hypothetical protein [Brachybacterium endophyticum]|uniref:hypothetical protein n=1 Tax=Brachybacterium endophyticum TaxID=2182385 RepID=UPI0010579FB4|nr:hypothetical protein [Brachybacterium endophyticum]
MLGLVGLLLGRLGETTWAPSPERTASVDLSDAGPAVVIDPGVLYVGGTQGTVKVTGSSDVSVITASNQDIDAYLDGTAYTRITGLSDWQTLTTEAVDADGEDTISDPTHSDLWRSVETTKSPASIDIADFHAEETEKSPQPYRAILLVTDGKSAGADSVSITWPVDETNEWVPYAYAAGATLLIVGLVMLVVSVGSSRRKAGATAGRGGAGTAAVGAGAAGTAVAADHAHRDDTDPQDGDRDAEQEQQDRDARPDRDADADHHQGQAPEPETERLDHLQDASQESDEQGAAVEPADEATTEPAAEPATEPTTEPAAEEDVWGPTAPITVGPGQGERSGHESAEGSEDPTEVLDRVEDPATPPRRPHRHRASTPETEEEQR